MNILDLPLKAIWYDMIESGEKKEEYREHNSYWAKRFYVCYDKNTDCRIYIPEKCKYWKYLQPIITQYFIDNKSEIWLLFLIAHSKR